MNLPRDIPRLDARFPKVTGSYIIASSLRTGSYLLCDALIETGVAGEPVEAFCPKYRALYWERWYLPPNPSFEDYFNVVVHYGQSPNGVFGVKIHRHHLDTLGPEISMPDLNQVLPTLFPNAKYIFLTRKDRRAQAISLYRAEATEEWWRIVGETNPFAQDVQPPFDAEAILAREDFLNQQEAEWENYFKTTGIEPCRVEYETLEKDYRGETGRLLKFLGQDETLAQKIAEPRFIRQRDETTEKWRKILDEMPTPPNVEYAFSRD